MAERIVPEGKNENNVASENQKEGEMKTLTKADLQQAFPGECESHYCMLIDHLSKVLPSEEAAIEFFESCLDDISIDAPETEKALLASFRACHKGNQERILRHASLVQRGQEMWRTITLEQVERGLQYMDEQVLEMKRASQGN